MIDPFLDSDRKSKVCGLNNDFTPNGTVLSGWEDSRPGEVAGRVPAEPKKQQLFGHTAAWYVYLTEGGIGKTDILCLRISSEGSDPKYLSAAKGCVPVWIYGAGFSERKGPEVYCLDQKARV